MGAGETTEERLGNTEGQYIMHMLVSGGCPSYKKSAIAVREEVEKMHPQLFEYVLVQEGRSTGNMEISVSKRGQASPAEGAQQQ